MNKLRVYFKRGLFIVLAASMIGFIVIELIDSNFNRYAVGTQVGDVYIGGLEKNSARTEVNLQSKIYINEVRFSWELYNQSEEISLDFVTVNIIETFDLISNGRKSFLVFDFEDGVLEQQISAQIEENIASAIDFTLLETDIKQQLTFMSPGKVYNLLDYISDYSGLETVLTTYTLEGENTERVYEILGDQEMIIEPLSRFSVLDYISSTYLTEEVAADIATSINALVVKSPFINIIKTNQRELPTYDNEELLMLNSLINSTQNIDYSFYNPMDQTFKIIIIQNGDDLEFRLLGIPLRDVYVTDVDITELTETINDEEVVVAIFVEVNRYKQRDGFNVFDTTLYTNYFGNVDETYGE